MSAPFDPYYQWLGIPPAEQPPHHYRLLGLQLFEGDAGVIDRAADRLMLHLRTLAGGQNAALSQRLLNEVSSARTCLLNSLQKAAYDQQLHARAAAARPMRPMAVASPLPAHAAASAVPPPAPPPRPAAVATASAGSPHPVQLRVGASRSPGGRRATKGDAGVSQTVMGLVKMVLGAAGGLSIAVLGVWIFFRSDPMGLFKPVPGKNTIAKKTKVLEDRSVVKGSATPPTTDAATGVKGGVQPGSRKGPATEGTTVPEATGPAKTRPTKIGPLKTRPQGTEPRETGPNGIEPRERELGPPFASEVPARDPFDTNPLTPRSLADFTSGRQALRPLSSVEQQQTRLNELKKEYKEDFDRSARDPARYLKFLLATADLLKPDPIARYVLLDAALDRQIRTPNYHAAAEIVDTLEGEYEVDPLNLRLSLLTEASKDAKQNKEREAIVSCASELADYAIRKQRKDEAEKLVRMIVAHATKLSDDAMRARARDQNLEIEKLPNPPRSVESARKRLAADPGDAEAAKVDGLYRCTVEGDWKAGLPLLARCSDEPLREAAEQDLAEALLAAPSSQPHAKDLGDRWSEIATSSPDWNGFYARARYWYRKAAERAADAQERAHIQERIKQVEATLPPQLLADPPPEEKLPPLAGKFSK